jgi:hypothetical protein
VLYGKCFWLEAAGYLSVAYGLIGALLSDSDMGVRGRLWGCGDTIPLHHDDAPFGLADSNQAPGCSTLLPVGNPKMFSARNWRSS